MKQKPKRSEAECAEPETEDQHEMRVRTAEFPVCGEIVKQTRRVKCNGGERECGDEELRRHGSGVLFGPEAADALDHVADGA